MFDIFLVKNYKNPSNYVFIFGEHEVKRSLKDDVSTQKKNQRICDSLYATDYKCKVTSEYNTQ